MLNDGRASFKIEVRLKVQYIIMYTSMKDLLGTQKRKESTK